MSLPSFCAMAFDHYSGEKCETYGETPDQYGNTESDFRNCCFPDCGCDGARLCMAGVASACASKCNVEGMWSKNGSDNGGAIGRARMELLGIINERKEP